MKTAIATLFLILPLLAFSQDDAYLKAPFLFTTKSEGSHTTITFKRSEYNIVQYVNYGASVPGGFSGLQQKAIFDGLSVRVDDMALFYLISASDTVAVKVIAPRNKNYYAIVMVNGRDLRTGRYESRNLWGYDVIVPELR